MSFKKADIQRVTTNRRISDVAVGEYNNLPAVRLTLESGEIGFFSKDRFDKEVDTWEIDTDQTVLLPTKYRLARSGYWTPFERQTASSGSFKLVGEA